MIFVQQASLQTISVSKQQNKAVLSGKRTRQPVGFTDSDFAEDVEDSFFTEHYRRCLHALSSTTLPHTSENCTEGHHFTKSGNLFGKKKENQSLLYRH